MDGFKEKKWFVYLGDHHEGPFSLEDIQTKISGGLLTATNYVWADGMPDWKMMTEIPTFVEVIANGQAALAPPPPPDAAPIESFVASPAPSRDAPAGEPALSSSSQSFAPAQQAQFAPVETSLAPELATASAISLEAIPVLEAAPILEATPVSDAVPAYEAAPTAPPVAEAAPIASPQAAPTNSRFTIQSQLQPALDTAGPAIHLEAASHNRNFGKSSAVGRSAASAPQIQKRSSSVMKWVGVIAILGGVGVAYTGGYFAPVTNSQAVKAGVQAADNILDPLLDTLSDKIPILGQWISPIPPLEDVTKEEYDQLKAAAKGNLDGTGPQLGLALSQADLFSPSFYLATNLPDGATFAVYVDGVPETLLNQLSFSAVGQGTVTKHLARITQLKSADGKPFPRGKYTIYLLMPDNQPGPVKQYASRLMTITAPNFPLPPNSRILMTKSYFLGGPRDATYTTRLKEFHDKLTARAQAELNECSQFTTLLESQLTGTTTKFALLRKGKRISNSQKKAWADFHKTWMTLADQIGQAFAKMTPETLKTDYFYGSLYLASQQASQAVAKLHDVQNAFFTTNADPKSFDIQLGEAASVAQSAINELKAKIDRIQKLPPNPNGMPVRDTL